MSRHVSGWRDAAYASLWSLSIRPERPMHPLAIRLGARRFTPGEFEHEARAAGLVVCFHGREGVGTAVLVDAA
jgi:hypothetical protein